MNINVTAQPAPGSTETGDLYVDAQSRQLWLGVDPSVDANGSVLISDIVALQAADTNTLTTAKAYTDSSLVPYARLASPVFTGDPRAPTVASTDNDTTIATTAFVKSVFATQGGPFVTGMIMMYSGSLANIGVGSLAGWALCDGANGTPNLRDRFILGAGNKLPGSTNPVASLVTAAAGSHTHTIIGATITVAQMPWHNHGSVTGYISHDHAHYVSGSTDTHGGHQHPAGLANTNVPDEGGWSYKAVGTDGSAYTGVAGAHAHAFSAWTGGVNTNHYHSVSGEGGNQAHTHGATYAADHTHSVTSAQLRDTMPWFALAYIMKL
jgi:hypothetical protein